MHPWYRRSALNRTSRWHQRPRKLQHQSLLLQWSRPVYKDSYELVLLFLDLGGLHTHMIWMHALTMLFSNETTVTYQWTYFSSSVTGLMKNGVFSSYLEMEQTFYDQQVTLKCELCLSITFSTFYRWLFLSCNSVNPMHCYMQDDGQY